LSSEFVIKKEPKQLEAKVFLGKEEIAEIKQEDLNFKLTRLKDKMEWLVTNLVHGEHRPFSFSVRKLGTKSTSQYTDSNDLNEIFVIRDQLFKHAGKFYMLSSHPEDKSWNEYVNSSIKYICRLDDFPYSELSDINYHHYTLQDKIKRLRGKAVGEASGLGIEERGHHVRLDNELEDIGLFIAAISYLLYASG
jgi:hypothetical protein